MKNLTLAILFFTTSQNLFAAIDLDFSHKRGYYNSSFQLIIEADNPNATIRYTTNKSKPSRNNGTIYNGPISVNGTELLRVFAYTNADESNVRTHSYIFVNDVINANYMYTYITQSSAYASQMENSLKALPVISLVSNNINGNNHIDTEIETSVEMFFPDNSRGGFMIHSGIQTWGGSPTNPKRNYRLEFKSIYGAPKLEYDVFKPDNYDDTDHKIQPVNKFDKLLLRSGSQDALNAEHGNENLAQYVRNRFLFDLQMEMGYVTPHGRYVHVYVNGDYMGHYHLLERPDANFFEAYYGGDETDYEVYKSGEIWDGPYTLNNSVWENLPSRINLSSQSNINNTNKHIDLDQAAAYLMLMSYASGFDWFENHNCLAGGNITPGNGGYKFLLWDVDFAIGNGGRWDPSYAGNLTYFTAPLNQDGPVPNSLNDNIEFRYMMADHMECTCYNSGILTTAKVDEAYMHRINQVKTALIAESARWGDYNFSYNQNGNNNHVQKNRWDVNGEFTSELNDMRNSYLPNRTSNMISNWVNNGITSDLKAVQYNQYGGITNQGFRLVLSNNNSNSRIYYTLDGSDPRAVGGGISSTAILYSSSVTLPNGPVIVKARVRDNNHSNSDIKKWSAMCPRKFYINQNYSDLVINEIHYNPKDSIFFNASLNANDTISGRHFEFIEIKNTGNTAVNLKDVAFNKGVTVSFGNNMIVGADDFFIVAEDSIAFNAKYGFYPDAIYQGKLSNSSENLWLVDPLNNIIDSLRYADDTPWDTKPDLGLYSLALKNVNSDNSNAANWAAQTVYTTPNAKNIFCTPIFSNPFSANASCSGGNDGFVVLAPSGGTSPYTYSWSSGQTLFSVSNLTAGDYTVTIKDALQCELIETFTITQPNPLSIAVLNTDQTYFQTNDGTAAVNTSGGTSPYSYSWSNGSNTSNINNLAPGNYTVTVTDANGCQTTKSTTINAVDCNNLSLTINKTDQTYFQTNDGSAAANIIGGAAPYSTSWDNGASGLGINNLPPGNYTATVTDVNGCKATKSTTINAVDCSNLSLSVSKTDETYFQANDGAAITNISGGSNPYSYVWNNGATTASINNLSPGNYEVDITDNKGCSASKAVTIDAIICNLIDLNISGTNETYFEAADGTASAEIINGIPPYIYSWSNGATTQAINNLPPGNYTLDIIDNKGCEASGSTTIAAIDCSNFILTASLTNETYFQAADGTATANPQNGTTPYSYSWNTGASAASINNLATGSYSVTVIDDLGCSATSDAVVSSVDCSSFALSVSSTNETYYQAEDGTALANPSGGATPYSYSWSNGVTTASTNNLAPGNYTVEVKDNLGCPVTETVTIVALDCSAFSFDLNKTDETYFQTNNGMASVNVTYGTSPYSYAWSNGSTTTTVNNLPPGNYTVLIEDGLGCSDVKNFSITAIDCSNFVADITSTDQTYFEINDGTAGVNTSGGTSPYTYSWSNGASTSNINNLPPGNYIVTVIDFKGCSATKNTAVDAVDCSNLSLTINKTDETYFQNNDGTATADITGGVVPYNYDWDNNATTSTINNLLPGNYTANITDNIGCSISKTVTINAINCNAKNLTVTGTSETYFEAADGTATATITNGIAPYSYSWSNGATAQTISDLPPDNYSVEVLDKVGCSASGSIIIDAIDCSNFSLTASSTNETIYQGTDGTATANPQNGTAPYNYSWDNGANTASISGLAAGNYSVTVTDDSGCSATAGAQVSSIDCAGLTLNVSSTNETYFQANDGTVLASPGGGTAPYNYNWSNGTTTASANNLTPGNYTVEVTDNLGCPVTETVTIAAIDCSAFDLVVNKTDETYFQTNDGTASANVVNGFAPYTYNWSDGSSTVSIGNLTPGNYTVNVEDNLGCFDVKNFIIEAIDCSNFEVNISATDETYFQTDDGTATATPLNGDAPYIFNWSNGDILSTINNLKPDNYTVDVTDNLGCKATAMAAVEAINCNGFSLSVNSNNETYFQENDGSAVANLTEGTTPFTYTWSNGETTSSVNNLVPGTYTLDVLDNLGCVVSEIVLIQAIDCSNFGLSVTATNETYFQKSDGTATANLTNGTSPYSYTWSNGASSATINSLAPNSYSVNVLDAVGCSLSESVSVQAVDCSSFSATIAATDENKFQANDGTASANPIGGSAPFTYEWSNNASTANVNNLAPGTYTVNIIDGIGCAVQQVADIAAVSCSNFSISTTTENETYFQTNNGMASVIPLNGIAPYAYNWSNGATTASVDNLAPGNYSITVEDAIACSRIENVTIAAIDCSNFELSITSTNETYYQSNNGTASGNLTNAISPFNYLWSNGDSTSTINNLSPGNYSLTVTDDVGCQQTSNIEITGIDCSAFSISSNSTDETYFQANDGTASVTAIGISPYTYNWSNSEITDSIGGLDPGVYSITATDALGCFQTDSVKINPLVCDSMNVLVEKEDETCFGKSDGSLLISGVQNATAPYTINWSNGNVTSLNNNITQGNYTLNITDNLGCTFSNNYIVDGMSEIIVNTSITDASSETEMDGAIDITVTGGEAPYSYYWSTAATTEDVSNLLAASYWVYITDSAGCNITKTSIEVGDSYTGICPMTLVQINAPRLQSGTEKVIDYISTNGYINTGNEVNYKAGSYIYLQNGFEVKLGAGFEADIEECE